MKTLILMQTQAEVFVKKTVNGVIKIVVSLRYSKTKKTNIYDEAYSKTINSKPIATQEKLILRFSVQAIYVEYNNL